VSDTGEIVRDTRRRQLTLAAPQAEAFSGYLDGAVPAGLRHLAVDAADGFATVVAVCLDDRPFGATTSILLSRTHVDADGRDRSGPAVTLAGLRTASVPSRLRRSCTRPRAARALLEALSGQVAWRCPVDARGRVLLPSADWHECELRYAPLE
jgi:hypothetical protein